LALGRCSSSSASVGDQLEKPKELKVCLTQSGDTLPAILQAEQKPADPTAALQALPDEDGPACGWDAPNETRVRDGRARATRTPGATNELPFPPRLHREDGTLKSIHPGVPAKSQQAVEKQGESLGVPAQAEALKVQAAHGRGKTQLRSMDVLVQSRRAGIWITTRRAEEQSPVPRLVVLQQPEIPFLRLGLEPHDADLRIRHGRDVGRDVHASGEHRDRTARLRLAAPGLSLAS